MSKTEERKCITHGSEWLYIQCSGGIGCYWCNVSQLVKIPQWPLRVSVFVTLLAPGPPTTKVEYISFVDQWAVVLLPQIFDDLMALEM